MLPGYLPIADIDASTDWSGALAGCDAVVHLAARVHVMKDTAQNPEDLYRSTNVDGTLQLARQAAHAGVGRLVFLSSIKVNGEATLPGKPFAAEDVPGPLDAYGRSKHAAEEGLKAISQETGMDVVIIRPPLVYGPGVKANFAAMLRAVRQGLPLPLGRVKNARSLIYVDNLCDLIAHCLVHDRARGETFLASDGEAVSTPALLRKVAAAMGTRARLVPVPLPLMRAAARLFGKSAAIDRLTGSLEVDITKTRDLIGWTPPFTMDEGLQETVKALGRGGA